MQQAFERKEKQMMSSPKAKYKLESIGGARTFELEEDAKNKKGE